MAGTGHDGDGHVAEGEAGGGSDTSFVWDDESQLYYHASSGFYHDPNAGWYYSTRDGLYYRYEKGCYLPWESGEKGDNHGLATTVSGTESQDQAGSKECFVGDEFEGPSPPSEWLEETLINLYLRGYSTEEANSGCSSTFETDGHRFEALDRLLSEDMSLGCVREDPQSDKLNEVERNRNIAEDVGEPAESSGSFLGEEASSYEENWLAQYGQVVKSEDENLLPFPIVDLWDWKLVGECGKKTQNVSRLVGRLVKRSMKLHPSMPAGGGILKTAPICEVYLDLVQVATGKVYRLRSPTAEYVSFLSSYDSSNPTKDWAFPRLNVESLLTDTASVNDPTEASNSILRCKYSSANSHHPGSTFVKILETEHFNTLSKHNNPEYRDRAAERRALHGSFSIGPGAKLLLNDNIDNGHTFTRSAHTAETAIEAVNMPFGAQSYGRRVLESMGWREGQALGKTQKGLLEPLKVAGNKGNAGLGWSSERKII